MSNGIDIELAGCSKSYGAICVLDDVSLKVKTGEFVTVLGPSGCGKTTTLRVIGGFVTPDVGEVTIRGRRVTDLPPYLRNIGVVFQNYALWPHMTAFENIAFGLRLRKLGKEDISSRVSRALGMVRLEGLEHRYPRELSGGQQQRVAMARALAIDPEVIILDEPLSNLDRSLREEMRLELKRLQRSLGVTMLFVTHDQEEALSMSDLVVVMHGGRIQQMADPRTVYQRPATAFVASFLGDANFLPGRIEMVEQEMARVALDAGLTTVASCNGPVRVGDVVRIAARPEWLSIHRKTTTGGIKAQVREVIFEGASIRYGIGVPGSDENLIFIQELAAANGFHPGDEVSFNVNNAVIVSES
ncbi:ABC transporter ATP-binding protein [Chelatococcus sp. YT9]|uniref:ABC transporter ATP-binding protein n=1 Tax=unclassified Chelatococcus TaxID=2638111 RepID=UPI001BCED8FB|nr:ABC transporter ATP-binding protein [Chelatococcus sp. YT9]MBX3558270.1 ABC transporter ATP-binding protein [Chelatococcus sp.]